MKPVRTKNQEGGIALIIVMLVILVLGVLAGGFAYSMKVETRLARNSSYEPEVEWLGRSGVELARYVLAQSLNIPEEPWDSLNQYWAGGPMGTNEALLSVSLNDVELGDGRISVRIEDLERRFNVNLANEAVFSLAFQAIGADPGEAGTLTDAFYDWRDQDNDPRIRGAETRDYIADPNPGFPPYVAKNGPLDSVSELLLLRGVTPELYYGLGYDEHSDRPWSPRESGSGSFGLRDLFTTISIGRININTANPHVLQLVPGIDEGLAHAIVETRAGFDGVDGNDDDIPYRSPGELINVPGMAPQIVGFVQQFFTTRSYTFQVEVDARIGEVNKRYVAVLRRNNPQDIQVLYFHPE